MNRDSWKSAESAHASSRAMGRKMEKRKGKMGRRRNVSSGCELRDKARAGAMRKTADWSVKFKQEV